MAPFFFVGIFFLLAKAHGSTVSIVFSSFHLNNPASSFGHTLIRVHQEENELLDIGISYGAVSDTDNAIVYAFKGLLGFFPGRYSVEPYYMKVREYNNFESRDLWEYELNLKPQAEAIFVAELEKLKTQSNDYWYLSDNCSYRLLTLLEHADPTLHLIEKEKKWTVPSDIVKRIWKTPGLVRKIHYRPSIRTQFLYRLQMLSAQEKKDLKILLETKDLSGPPNRDILDAALDFSDTEDPLASSNFRKRLLQKRIEVDSPSRDLDISPSERERPHEGHSSRRFNFGHRGSKIGEDLMIFGFKNTLHGRTDLVTGYPEYAGLTMGDFQFSYSRQGQRLEVEDLNLIEAISYSPISSFQKSVSWRWKTGVEKIRDENCLGCHGLMANAGVGFTFPLFEDIHQLTWFWGLKGGLYYTPWSMDDHLLSGWGPSSEIRWRWTDQLISTLEAWYRQDLHRQIEDFQEVDFTTQYSWNATWAGQIKGSDVRYDKTAQVQIFYFY